MKSVEELEAAQKQGDLDKELFSGIISQTPLQKITQKQLNRLIVNYTGQDEIKFRDLLEKNNYFPDLSGLTVDGNKFKALQKLDFSGLSLTSSKLHNLAAADISFAESDLSNANIQLEDSVGNIDFARANLTRSYIYGMEMSRASFDETIMHNSIIINSQNDKSPLSEQQKAQTIDLVIAPESSFKQVGLIAKYDILDQDGVCNGLCVELARYVLMSQEKDGGYGDYLEKVKRKIENPSMNFIYRVQSYQDHLQAPESDITIDTEKVRNHQFLESIPDEIKHSDILGCGVSVSDKADHIFSVIKLRDETRNIVGYKVFDPNYGDITCKNEAELNQQVNLLFQHYQRDATNIESTIEITALDDLVKKHGLIHPKNVNFSEEEKAANKEKKYAKMSEQEKFYLIIASNKSTNADIAKAKTKIESMSIYEINQPITLNDGSTTSLLMLAVKANKLEIVEALIKNKAEVNTPNVDAISPLCISAIRKYTAIKEALIKAGADGSIKYGQSISAELQEKLDKELITSATLGETEQTKMLLEKGANLSAKDKKGRLPIHWAAYNGNLEIIQSLLAAGADVNAKDYYGLSPIRWSGRHDKKEVVNSFIKAGANPTGLNKEFISDEVIISLFKEASRDNDHKAIYNLIKLINNDLLKQEFKIKIVNEDIFNIVSDHKEILAYLEILKDLGANINARNKDGNTALHIAAREGKIETLKELIVLGADIDTKDKSFKKVIDLIKENDDRVNKSLANRHNTSSFIVHLINKGSGYIRDDSDTWKAVESIVKNINEDSRVDIICEVFEEIKNTSRRSRLLKLLPEDEQERVKHNSRPTVLEAAIAFNNMLSPYLDYTPTKNTEEKGKNVGNKR